MSITTWEDKMYLRYTSPLNQQQILTKLIKFHVNTITTQGNHSGASPSSKTEDGIQQATDRLP